MPLYQVKCGKCGEEQEIFRHIKDFDDLPKCCNKKMHRVICPSQILLDIQPYKSMIDGSMITSRSKHREHLKQHGCIEVGNEKLPQPKVGPPPGLKDAVINAVNAKIDQLRGRK